MNVLLRFLLYAVFFCAFTISGFAFNNLNLSDIKQTSAFTQNKGQLTDQHGKPRNDVKYIYTAPGMKVIFKANSFSYEVYTIEKNQHISEASGKQVNQDPFTAKNHEPEDVTISTHRIDISLAGANRNPQIIVQGKNQNYSNYYLTHTPEEGIQKVYSYNQLTYKDIWQNIDIVFYAKKEGELKYDIVLHPGADINDLKFAYTGAVNISLLNGKLNLQTTLGNIQESIPFSYLAESKEKVNIEYTKTNNNINFTGEYDKHKTLVIDPQLSWSTYYGGINPDEGYAVITDSKGNVYLSGSTNSTSNIATSGAHQTSGGISKNIYDAFLVKLDRAGVRQWATYYGGTGHESSFAIKIDASDNILMAGSTESSTSIATSGSHQQSNNGNTDAFLVKFDDSGKRIWATYYGGPSFDVGLALTIDIIGNIYLTGATISSTGISTYNSFQSSFQGTYGDGFLVKFNANGIRQWATYYGGKETDEIKSVVTDSLGNIYITGYTESTNNIASSGAYQTSHGGGRWYQDCFLAKFDSSGLRIWGTYFGGSGNDQSNAVALDNDGNIFIVGQTESSTSISTPNAFQRSYSAGLDGFVIKFDSSGSRIWGTYFGGSSEDIVTSVVSDAFSNIYITGYTRSSSSIVTSNAYQTSYGGGAYDAFLAIFDNSGNCLWSTYYGGSNNDYSQSIALDSFKNIYIGGRTASSGSIATQGAYQTSFAGSTDVLLAKFSMANADVSILDIDSIARTYCSDSISKKIYVKIKNYSQDVHLDSVYIGWSVNGIAQKEKKYSTLIKAGQTSIFTSLGIATFSTGINKIKIWTYNPNGEKDLNTTNDTFYATFSLYAPPSASFLAGNNCLGEVTRFINTSTISTGSIISYLWRFGDGDSSTSVSPDKTYKDTGTYTAWLIITSDNGCKDSISKIITVSPRANVDFSFTNACFENTIGFTNKSTIYNGILSYKWDFGDNTTSNSTSPIKTYLSAGSYSVKLVVLTNGGCIDSLIKAVTIYPRPEANFTIADNCANKQLSIINSTSISNGKVNYLWYFGDGTISTDSIPAKAFSAPGIYSVKLFATSNFGCTDSAAQTITIYPRPTPKFTVKYNCQDSSTQFINNSTISNGSISYLWAFGDGDSSVSITPSHHYANPGTYSVKLITTSNNGCKDSTSQNITIYPKPKAEFGLSGDLCLGGTLNFKDSSSIDSGNISDFEWDFGDGNKSIKQNPAYSFANAGNYDVKLKIKSSPGCTYSTTKKITIYSIPDLFITDSISERNVKFAVSNNSYSSYTWTFGDGDSSSTKNPLHRYPAVGIYKILLLVKNQYGCEKLFTDSVQITTNSIIPENGKPFVINIYPNPFRESFNLEYTLAKPSSIAGGIYDITGRKVFTISNNTIKQPGKYTQTIDTNEHNLQPGIYMLRTVVNGQATTKRLIRIE